MVRTIAFALLCAALGACGLSAVGKVTSTDGMDGGGGGQGDGSTLDAGVDAPADASDAATDAKVEAGADAGMALSFDGSGYVDLGDLEVPAGDFTIEAWIRPHAFDVERCILAKDKDTQKKGQFRLGIDGTGHVFFIMSDDAGDSHGLFDVSGPTPKYTLTSSFPLAANQWSHVAVTRNGTLFALFLNGGQQSPVDTQSAFEPGDPGVSFRIGARAHPDGSPDGAFNGDIDEVRIWSVVRSDIAGSKDGPIDAADPSFDDLVAYYRFDDGAGVVAADETGSQPGDLIGAPKAPQWVPSDAFDP